MAVRCVPCAGVLQGEVVITRHEVDTPTVEAELQKCLPGDFFGERALLTNGTCTLTSQ